MRASITTCSAQSSLSLVLYRIVVPMNDETELGIEAITEVIEDPEKRRAVARIMRRNSMVSKILIYVIITIFTGVLAGIGAQLSGLIDLVD